MDFATVVELLSFAVLDALPVQAPVVVTIFPERWTRLTRDCPSSSIEAIADSCVFEPTNVVFVSDAKKRAIVAVQLHCPVVTSLVAGGGDAVAGQPGFGKGAGLISPAGLVVRRLWLGGGKSRGVQQWWSTFLLVADTGPGSIVAIDVGPYLQQQTRVVEGDANVPGFDEQATRPGAATAPRRNRLAYSSPLSLTFVDGATMSSPYALCFANPPPTTHPKLYVTDISPATPAVVLVDAKNIKFNVRDERPAFRGTVSRVVSLPSGCEPRSIAYHYDSGRLLVGDAQSTSVFVIDPKAGRQLRTVDAVSFTTVGAAVVDLPGGAGAGPSRERRHGVWGLEVRADGSQLAATLWPSSVITVDLEVDATTKELVFSAAQLLLSGVESTSGTQHDDVARLATCSRPRGPAYHGKSILFVDAANGVRLVTDVGPLRGLLQMFSPLAAMIGFLPGCRTLSWDASIAALESLVMQLRVWEAEAMRRTGKTKPGAMQGPQGMISGSVRGALNLLLSSVRDVHQWLKAEYAVDLHKEGVTFDRLLTLCDEVFFAKIRCGPTGSSATLMELEYRQRRAAIIADLLRGRFSAADVNLFTSAASYYPAPRAQRVVIEQQLDSLPDPVEDPARTRARGLSRTEYLRELSSLNDQRAEKSGSKTRQQVVRTRTMDLPGTGPSEQISRPPQPIQPTAEDASLLENLLSDVMVASRRRGAQQNVSLDLRSGGFVAVLSLTEEQRAAWEEGDVMRRVFLAQTAEDIFKKADGSWLEANFEASWLLNDSADDPQAYSYERNIDGDVAKDNLRCDSILCAIELNETGENDGHESNPLPILRLADETLLRLRGLQQEATDQTAEAQLAREAEQLRRVEEERAVRRGAEAARAADTSSTGRKRTISGYQAELQAQRRRG